MIHAVKTAVLLSSVSFFSAATQAKLVLRIDEPKPVAERALVRIHLKNTFKQKVESARATLFLLDDKNKVVDQSTAWVIGNGKEKPPLAPDATVTYNFLVRAEKPFTTTRLTFSRIVLEGGKLADPVKDFELEK